MLLGAVARRLGDGGRTRRVPEVKVRTMGTSSVLECCCVWTCVLVLAGCGKDAQPTLPEGPVNTVPVVSSILGPDSARVFVSQAYICSAFDADGDPMTFSWSEPSDSVDGPKGWFTWTSSGSKLLHCMASDGKSTGTSPTKTILVSPPLPSLGLDPHPISSGQEHSCALDEEGRAYCWGAGDFGQLGNGTLANRRSPTELPGVLRFVRVNAGRWTSCGVQPSGVTYCWGRNRFGQVGDGGAQDHAVPTRVSGGLLFADVVGGDESTCALTPNGEPYCWGRNHFGQLGSGDTTSRSVPSPVAGGLRFTALAADNYHACGLDGDGVAFCWGDNSHGALGTGDEVDSAIPVQVAGELRFRAIVTGWFWTCALALDGIPYCWGYNFNGSLGNGTRVTGTTTPAPVSGGYRFTQLTGAYYHTCALDSDGRAYCWGLNTAGELGDGALAHNLVPEQVVGDHQFTWIETGAFHTCGLTTEGDFLCWGMNRVGALGDGTTTDSSVPVLVAGVG